MFALVIPGRLVQIPQQVPTSPERFVAIIPDAQTVNHLTVFLDGTTPFPEGYACTIHFDQGKGWQLIGALSNTKPSAIFRLRGNHVASSQSSAGFASTGTHLNATLGILCEPSEMVEAQVAALGADKLAEVSSNAAPSTSTAMVLARSVAPTDAVALAQKVALNLFNHVGGFAQPLPDGRGSWVDFGVIEKWYRNFETKLRTRGVGFLLQED